MRYRDLHADFSEFCDDYTYSEGAGLHKRYPELQVSEHREFHRHSYLQPIEDAILKGKTT